MEKLRKNKGITLIALVITIIVLLILAGVSIAMLTGNNGILTQAQRAKNETEKASIEEEKILSTIKSRCTKITFQPIEQDKLKEILKKQYQYENISEHLLTFFNGSIKKALKEKKEVYEQIEKMVLGIKQMNKIEMLNQKNNIDKEEIINILEYMNLLFWEQSTQVDTKERESAVKSILIIEETKKRIQSNCNFDMTVDNMLMQLWEEWNEKNDRS